MRRDEKLVCSAQLRGLPLRDRSLELSHLGKGREKKRQQQPGTVSTTGPSRGTGLALPQPHQPSGTVPVVARAHRCYNCPSLGRGNSHQRRAGASVRKSFRQPNILNISAGNLTFY